LLILERELLNYKTFAEAGPWGFRREGVMRVPCPTAWRRHCGGGTPEAHFFISAHLRPTVSSANHSCRVHGPRDKQPGGACLSRPLGGARLSCPQNQNGLSNV